jgi:hypothetical protein
MSLGRLRRLADKAEFAAALTLFVRIVRAVFKLRCVHHGRRAMTVGSIAVTARTADVADFTYALNFAAPYLVEKLLKDGVVESAFDADALFTEVKRRGAAVPSPRTSPLLKGAAVPPPLLLRIRQVLEHFAAFAL